MYEKTQLWQPKTYWSMFKTSGVTENIWAPLQSQVLGPFRTLPPRCGGARYATVQNSKNSIDADFEDENKMDNAASVPTSYEMRNIMKSMRSNLDALSNGEINNKMDDIEQSVAKTTIQRKK
ncbi:hypothetical protein TNCV_2283721 [Trichonephila clavipes]|nr:hypothetical protein TNCV_2283721 [Trichonephila clavipes]